MMKNKISFITELLDSKKIQASQKERLFQLTANELKKNEERDEKILSEIEAIKKQLTNISEGKVNITESGASHPPDSEGTTKPSGSSKNSKYHNPKIISVFLKNFRENTNLKFSTHIWDSIEKYADIDTFIIGLEADKKNFKFSNLFNHNADLYNLINYFLYKPKQEIVDGIPKYGWPNLNEIKIGWQFPGSLLIDWCRKNYDNQLDSSNFKFPMQFSLPQNLKPKKRIGGITISTFENVVNVFKNEIEFRDNYLYEEIEKKRNMIIPDFKVESFESLKGIQFYTYTRGVTLAIGRIFEMFKKNEIAKTITINATLHDNIFTLTITQNDSFPTKKIDLNNLKNFIGGDTNDIIKNVFSLCDYSIISKFKIINGEEKMGEFKILFNDAEYDLKSLISNPEFITIEDNVEGFTHQFKFYL
ncbi:hypothetical protein ACSVH5_02385 [Flavobacterium sp. RSSA_27]|uniref:hypothetical protein n=1 Tax=Flavobacterium sp. RSSA_27 TaxID=3447667 RepID=UPI003F407650